MAVECKFKIWRTAFSTCDHEICNVRCVAKRNSIKVATDRNCSSICEG